MRTGSKLAVVAAVVVCAVVVMTLSQRGVEGFSAGFDAEFLERADGYPGLSRHYDLEIPGRIRQMDPGLMYRAVRDGDVDVINAFATDGRIPAYDLAVLEDDEQFFPPYYAAPLVRADALRRHPVLREALNLLAGRIGDDVMQGLNYRVDELNETPQEVAADFIAALNLEGDEQWMSPDIEGAVAVGSKHFTEQEILGEMVAILIDDYTGLRAERRLNLGGTMICFNALRAGDLDVYVEYTGTGLMNILGRDVIPDPIRAHEAVRDAFKEQYDLVWLDSLGFNNTYTLTMRRDDAERLGIETISDLADHLRD